MAIIISSLEQFQEIQSKSINQKVILFPIYSDARAHPGANTVCLWVIYLMFDGTTYIVPVNHSEVVNLKVDISTISAKEIWTLDKKSVMQHCSAEQWNDIGALEYLTNNSITTLSHFYSPTTKHTLERLSNHLNINTIIPIYHWTEICENYLKTVKPIIESFVPTSAYEFINYKSIPVFSQIESSKICVDKNLYSIKAKRFVDPAGMTHSQYNLYTTTGRPSNTFGGVNFAALNKHDETRKAFISRFGKKGTLILFDYEAFHLRIIADLIQYKLPATSVHEYFGQWYFNTDKLTPDQYEESKQITFKQLYGEIASQIPFFSEVNKFKKELFEKFIENGEIGLSQLSRTIKSSDIWNATESKVFNYLVQLLETELNVTTLKRVLQNYEHTKSKVILYTYDSILIDYYKGDGIDLVKETKRLLECEGKYPCRVFVGDTYHDLKDKTYVLN